MCENFNDCSARVIRGKDRIESVAGKGEIERFDKGAGGEVVGDDNIAA